MSGPSNSVVCAINRFPYSSLALTEMWAGPARSETRTPRLQARVAATVIMPTAPHNPRTVAIPRPSRGDVGWFTWTFPCLAFVPDHSFAHRPESGVWAAQSPHE